MKKFFKGIGIYIVIFLIAAFMINYLGKLGSNPVNMKLDSFINEVEKGNITNVVIKDQDNYLTAQKKSELKGKNPKTYKVTYPEKFDITKLLIDNGVEEFESDPQSNKIWYTVILNVLPFLFIIIIAIFLFQQMQGGGNKVMSFGKSRAKLLSKDQPKTTFKDVAGLDEAVEELMEIKEFLSNPGKFQKMGARIPKGVLLYGPPGSGKTLLARAVAGEAGVPFFSISGSDFVEMFVGVGASRVRDLFEQAKTNAPCIIFMDEIDAVGRHRGAGLGGGHDEREQTLNQLLVEMDGFDIKDNIIMIAATNRPDILDPALLRPGRFDRQIVIDRPDLEGRKGILKVHFRGKPISDEVSVDVLARRTPGFTGADLSNLVNEAALLTARHNKKKIDMEELEEAIDRVIAGPERKTRLISDKEKMVIAYHEAGHALVAHELPNTDPVHKISIIPRGRALGYTLTLPTEDRYLVTKSELSDELAMLLGGRVAEEMIFKDITTGAQNDLDRTTKIARQMVCEYGMSDELGPLTLGQKQDQVFLGRDFTSHPDYSQEIAFEIDKEIRRIVDESFEKANRILTKRKKTLEKIANKLIEVETLEKEELISILENKPIDKVIEEQKAAMSEKEKEDAGEKAKTKKKAKDIKGKLGLAEN